jgi:lysylphosphatidylglycerol synthetase-like protein (DUF2156 family)
MSHDPMRPPLPLTATSVCAWVSAVVLLAFTLLLLVHVRAETDPDGIWLVPTTAVGCGIVGALARQPHAWAWVAVALLAGCGLAFGVPCRLTGAAVVGVLLLPSSLRFMGLLGSRDVDANGDR